MGDQATTRGRPGYWFPLALLGFGLIVLLGCESVRTAEDFGWFAYTPNADGLGTGYIGTDSYTDLRPGAEYTSVSVLLPDMRTFPMRDFPWFVLVMTTLVGTVAWYGWLARKAGRSVRSYVLLALGCLVAVPAAYVATGMASSIPDADGMVTSVGLPLVGFGLLAGAWAYLRLGPWRRGATVTSAVCLTIGTGTVLGLWAPGLLDPVLIAGGLLVLARFERSRVLAIVASLLLIAMVVFPLGTTSMLVPALVALAAAMAILVRHNGSAPA